LDSSSTDNNLKTGTKLDLPFWLVKAIHNEKFKFVNIEIPKEYRPVYHEILRADPCVVDLRKLGPYYYDFGTLLVQLDHLLSQDIAKILLWVSLCGLDVIEHE
jgi:GINS complex subunit 3